jgi:DNA-binding winged helix-turn-helix (wHTH) protein
MGRQMVKFAVLVPVELFDGERRLVVGGPRQLALLAFLFLNANRAVSSDRLIDALWGGGQDPRGSAKRLQVAIARLRKALDASGPEATAEPVLRTVAGGYLLAVRPGELDAEVFEARLKDGRRALEPQPVLVAPLLADQARGLSIKPEAALQLKRRRISRESPEPLDLLIRQKLDRHEAASLRTRRRQRQHQQSENAVLALIPLPFFPKPVRRAKSRRVRARAPIECASARTAAQRPPAASAGAAACRALEFVLTIFTRRVCMLAPGIRNHSSSSTMRRPER